MLPPRYAYKFLHSRRVAWLPGYFGAFDSRRFRPVKFKGPLKGPTLANEGGEGWQDFSFFFLFLPLSSGVSSILGQGTTAGRSCRSETVRDPSETLHPVPLHLVLGPSRTLVL